MLDRYTSAAMAAIWSDQRTLELWREVELAVLEAWTHAGAAGASTLAAAQAAPAPLPREVALEERRTRHDVVAFVNVWTAGMPTQVASWVHRGVTSSDIVDTATGLRLSQVSDLLLTAADRLVAVLRDHALAHQHTVQVGRTHGQHAAPVVWGLRVADFAFAVARCRDRLAEARTSVAVAKVSGPVGSYAGVSPDIERRVAGTLGLRPIPVATQVVMRDSIAHWMSCLALLASVCEAIALEVRHGARSEVAELAESFRDGQAGSSAMPHKRNPVTAEKICGLARVVRGYVNPVMEGVALWHQRDISHSSVERVCLPDASAISEHLLTSTAELVTDLVVDTARMRDNLAAAGASVFSHAALAMLLDSGLDRRRAYALIQRRAHAGDGQSLMTSLQAAVLADGIDLPPGCWAAITDLDRELAEVGAVFARLRDLS
ncbi:MAG: adenylosuccinate lyase [Jatrophihabitantaceae bacterium]